MNIYIISYTKKILGLFNYTEEIERNIICKNEKEVIKKIKEIYQKYNYIYPENLTIKNIYLTEKEINKLKEKSNEN